MRRGKGKTEQDWRMSATVCMIWFASFDGGDWLCTLYRLPDGNARLEYRYRYDGADGGEDERRWYVVKPKLKGEPGVEELRGVTRTIGAVGLLGPLKEIEEVEVVGGDIIEALRDKPWAHILPTAAGTGEA